VGVAERGEDVALRVVAGVAKVCVVVRVEAATATRAAIAQTATTSSSR
jgi:hypothetical protein